MYELGIYVWCIVEEVVLDEYFWIDLLFGNDGVVVNLVEIDVDFIGVFCFLGIIWCVECVGCE